LNDKKGEGMVERDGRSTALFLERKTMCANLNHWGLKLVFLTAFVFFFAPLAQGQQIDWGPFQWGATLDQLNSSLSEKNQIGQVREDTFRIEIEIQYTPSRVIKARKGNLVALNWTSNPSMAGRLYGYTYEGKLFGRVLFFKDYPEIFPETVIGTLKKKYPEGRIYRSFVKDRFISLFDYKSDQQYVFTTERGIFFYDPAVLDKIVKKYQAENEEEIKRFEEKQPDIKAP
jgi:hypothetical protein